MQEYQTTPETLRFIYAVRREKNKGEAIYTFAYAKPYTYSNNLQAIPYAWSRWNPKDAGNPSLQFQKAEGRRLASLRYVEGASQFFGNAKREDVIKVLGLDRILTDYCQQKFDLRNLKHASISEAITRLALCTEYKPGVSYRYGLHVYPLATSAKIDSYDIFARDF